MEKGDLHPILNKLKGEVTADVDKLKAKTVMLESFAKPKGSFVSLHLHT